MSRYNYYDILEVSESASVEVIKAAYRTLSKRYHPDICKGNSLPKDIDMALVNEAYEVLSDVQKRRKYDETLKKQKSSSPQNQVVVQDCDSQAMFTKYNYKNEDSTGRNNFFKEDAEFVKSGWFGEAVRNIGNEVVGIIKRNSREIENAYLLGLAMDDFLLVKHFMKSSGVKRVGYIKALEEKGILERNCKGKLIPTYRFKQLL